MSTASCAFCGAEQPATAMDMTGNGWRCASCALQTEIATARGQPHGIREHLTLSELEGVAREGRNQAIVGVAIAVGSAAMLSIGGLYFVAGIFAGFATSGHGLYRRRQAKAALQDAPGARVVNR